MLRFQLRIVSCWANDIATSQRVLVTSLVMKVPIVENLDVQVALLFGSGVKLGCSET